MGKQTVHIAFVGYEVQRVSEPVIQLKGTKAYLFTSAPDDTAQEYWNQVHKELRKYGIPIIDKIADPWNVGEILRAYRAIIDFEKLQGNDVAINVSTGSKMAVLAGMMAAMLWGVRVYYAHIGYAKQDKVRDYGLNLPPGVTKGADGGKIEAIRDITWLPVLRITGPQEAELQVIGALMTTPEGMSKDTLIRRLVAVGAFPAETNILSTAMYMRLNRLLKPMQDNGQVRIEGERKKARIHLTHEGRDVGLLLLQPWLQEK